MFRDISFKNPWFFILYGNTASDTNDGILDLVNPIPKEKVK
jgi:hypothetical protein|tara:strand:- start:960 stop:1082 length:123 start_codon:yes stop_codon:yes gene_type:complete